MGKCAKFCDSVVPLAVFLLVTSIINMACSGTVLFRDFSTDPTRDELFMYSLSIGVFVVSLVEFIVGVVQLVRAYCKRRRERNGTLMETLGDFKDIVKGVEDSFDQQGEISVDDV